MNSFVEVGTCYSSNDIGSLTKFYCLNDDDKNYCCIDRSTSSLDKYDSSQSNCCSYEEYGNQHWVTLAIIKILFIVITVIFLNSLLLFIFFFSKCIGLKEADIKERRRVVLKELKSKKIIVNTPASSRSLKIDETAISRATKKSNVSKDKSNKGGSRSKQRHTTKDNDRRKQDDAIIDKMRHTKN